MKNRKLLYQSQLSKRYSLFPLMIALPRWKISEPVFRGYISLRLASLIVGLFLSGTVEAGVLDDCPYKSIQAVSSDRVVVHPDETLTFSTRSDDEMRGRWGGKVRAELNSYHNAYLGETWEYEYSVAIDDVPMNYPVVIFQLKQTGHSPTVALEWRNNYVYLKHRYIKNGKQIGPTLGKRQYIRGERFDWRWRVKWSHGNDGFIKIFHSNKQVDLYQGVTLLPDSNTVHLKYGIYSWRFVDGVTSRQIRVVRCKTRKLK